MTSAIDLHRETEVAWAAGFFDGEGSVHVTHSNGPNCRPYVQISVSQSGGIEVVKKFYDARS